MKVHEKFNNVFSYAAGIEAWCRECYPSEMHYTFCSDFAIADWVGGKNSVMETYERVKNEWLSDYKAFTEVAVSINMLSWANNQLAEQGIEDREEFIQLYSELYYKARDDFYEKYSGNDEATEYFFEMTD